MAESIVAGANDSNSPIQETIRAKRIELVRDDGSVVAILGLIDKHPLDGEFVTAGSFGLAILDSDGNPQIRLCGRSDGDNAMEGLTIYTDNKAVRTQINAGMGLGGLIVQSGNFELAVGSFGGGTPVLQITQLPENEPRKERVLLDADAVQFTDIIGVVKFKAPS